MNEMELTREEMVAEAVKRMKLLEIHPNAIRDFESNGRLNYSAYPLGTLFWLGEDKQKLVDEFEAEFGGVVYHCIETPFEFGTCLSMLYVSKHRDEWEYDVNDLMEGYAFAYVANMNDPACSEFGSIGIMPRWGGVVQVA